MDVKPVVNQPCRCFPPKNFHGKIALTPSGQRDSNRHPVDRHRCQMWIYRENFYVRPKKKRNSSVNLTYVVKIFYSLLLLLLILLFAFLHRLFSPGTPANPRPSRLDITRVNPRRKQLMNKRGARPRTIDTSAKLFASQNCLLIRRENDRL